MQKLMAIIGVSLLVTGCGVNGPPVIKPAPKDVVVPSTYPPEDPIEEQLEQQARARTAVRSNIGNTN